jgi:Cu(I)/Ag(I) efflux system protein CusF
MRTARASAVSIALLVAAAAAALSAPLLAERAASADERYAAHGVVKSFGPKRSFVNIAHEKIPGYMEAMTMSFEPRSPDQLAGIDVGARVAFTFVATSDGRRVLETIAKE